MEILPSQTPGVQTFSFGGAQFRALLAGSEPMFIGVDACAALELKNPWDAMGRLEEDDLGIAEVIDSLGRTQKMKTVTEAGLYQLIFQSRTDGAKAFKRWVTSEVLPAIRKTGEYAPQKSLEQRSLELLGELTARVQEQQAELEVARPKAETYDKVLTKEHTFGFRDLCKHLREHFPVNEADVKRVLRQKHILTYQTKTGLTPRQRRVPCLPTRRCC